MKRILYLLLFILLASCQKMPIYKTERHLNIPWHPIFPGTVANDGTGDDLRTAVIQYNTTIAAVADSLENKYTKAQIDAKYPATNIINGADVIFYDEGDTANPYIPLANRSSITVTTDDGYIRFFQNGVELKVVAYSPILETNYYVKNGGDDTKSGLTDADAWAHHPWMSTWTGSVTLVPGDVVNMKRGDTWTIAAPAAPYMTIGQNGSAGKPIITTAYGTGALPIINISTGTDQPVVYGTAKSFLTFDNLHITHQNSTYTGDVERCGFYLENECHDITFTNNEINNIPFICIYTYGDSYNITVGNVNAVATATTTAYSNHIHDFGYAGVMLQGVNSATSESNFKVYYNYIHDATRTVNTDNEYGIIFTAAPSPTSTNWPKYAYARYNYVSNIKTWEALDVHAGSYIYFQDNFITCFGKYGLMAGGSGGGGYPVFKGDHYYIERNIFEQNSTFNWVTGNEGAFITLYSSDAVESLSDIYITDNILRYTSVPATGPFIGIYIHNVEGATIEGNKLYDGSAITDPAFFFDGSRTADITITRNYVNYWAKSINLTGVSITGALNITSNILITYEQAPITITTSSLSATADVTIYNNTFIARGTGDYIIISSTGTTAGSSIVVKNNIMGYEGATNPGYYIYLSGTNSGTLDFDYNLYWHTSSADCFRLGTTYYTFAEWQTAGYSANSPNTTSSLDPLFTNGSGLYNVDSDFALGTGSPAINVGVNTGVTTDYYGNPRVGNYDIGAIEKQ